uniref:Movement protein n=1 Tax=Caenorhabditis tropicalis TaxID=1561998 RepID=A0A1I7U945_9PELO
MDNIQSFFDQYVHLPPEISGKHDHVYIILILLSVILILLLLICNICICYFIRQRRRRELIDYPSNTLQYIPFPRNIRKPYRHDDSSTSSSNRMMLPSSSPRHPV